MVDFHKYLLFISLSTVVLAAPGPTVFFTLSNGLSGNRSQAIAGILGTVSANIIWISCCAIGIATFISDSQFLFSGLKYSGAIYLLYLGVLSFRNRSAALGVQKEDSNPALYSVFLRGMLTSLSNPKALLYYLAFFPQFVTGDSSYALQICWLGSCYILILFTVLGLYIFISEKISFLFRREKFYLCANKLIGVGFIGASIAVFTSV